MKIKSKIIIVVIVFLAFVAIYLFNMYNEDKKEYLSYYDEYSEIESQIKSYSAKTNSLQTNELYYEDYLYEAFDSYYEESDDEVFRYVFKERFPVRSNYENDREGAFIVIYALLELYPELRDDEDIDKFLVLIDDTIEELKDTINLHNECIDKYENIVEKINSLDYIKIWHGKPSISKKYNKIIFIEP